MFPNVVFGAIPSVTALVVINGAAVFSAGLLHNKFMIHLTRV